MAGDAEETVIEGVLLIIVLAVAVVMWEAWRNGGGIAGALTNIVRKFWNAIDSIFSGLMDTLTPSVGNADLGTSADWVYTGTDTGTYTGPAGSDYGASGGN